ncbi:DNA alkylation repair protein [Lactiplantibacillus garii]|uniref:DNA alkylation repair protein n=1 Tax=Lactiplantibacillus garii TaxID=2306423 RepID=A0A426D550_9LACO|nr:DNA alkylation repair protein [Lactiplantibacillus garii]RRK09746.1 DNA alkylation repair protein [Lactiplantibacillus garii]
MANVLKDLYSPAFIDRLGAAVTAVQPNFDGTALRAFCLTSDWPDLKLMDRRDRITAGLHAQLPADFKRAAAILRQIGSQFHGLAAICLPNYVAEYGLNDWQTAMTTLAELTRYSSAEFAIRPFILRYPERTARQMLTWAASADEDVRRLASEGMRPRLPWGIRLKPYVDDPAPIMPILTRLIGDSSVYVQKSVANNLNDISKDHPDLVIQFAQRYWGQSPSANWILTRGLRTLFKQGVPAVLTLLGYDQRDAALLTPVRLTSAVTRIAIGEVSALTYKLRNPTKQDLPLYLGYRVHYVRQNKSDAFKDFFLKRLTLKAATELTGQFTIKWRQLTTRKLYPGEHAIELLVNTVAVAGVRVQLSE